MTTAATPDVATFISRWSRSGAAERANYAGFLYELCAVLGVPTPDPTTPDDAHNAYVFERSVTFRNNDGSTSTGRIDLYKRGCFVLEAKQGLTKDETEHLVKPAKTKKGTALRDTKAWDDAMVKARGQAEQYVRALPAEEGNPPFVVVVDVGHSIELYSDFSRLGKTYTPFPDSTSHRLKLADLERPEIKKRLAAIWTDPLSLDPTRRSAKVTRVIAGKLAELAKSLEKSGHPAESVAHFLMRCLFTLFAEDVRLIKERAFTELLKTLKDAPDQFPHLVRTLWTEMDRGGFSVVLRQKMLRFNGGLFADQEALPLTAEQLAILTEAAEQDWQDVEPAIFGTLLERALDPVERHKLGAHYTPRAYVERLVVPTVIEPLREDWRASQTAAITLAKQGKTKAAVDEVHAFLKKLCNVTVLDPACGSGNFLYVTLHHLKHLEGEVRDTLSQLGEQQLPLEYVGLTVDPHQLKGLEINPRAAAIADLVLWIGYLQWHFRTHGNTPPAEPVLKKFDNILTRDAVLEYDEKKLVTDETGKPVTRWDGHSYKKHPVTGEDVPDEAARVPSYKYVNPHPTRWPKADYIIGNPPYIGARRIRTALGDEYVETLRAAYPEVPETCDLVMYWWDKAATAVGTGQARRFGLITTDSIVQAYSRPLIESHLSNKDGIALKFAIADHPWVEAADGAAVRVAMTVGMARRHFDGHAVLGKVVGDWSDPETAPVTRVEVSEIGPELRSGNGSVQPLMANEGMCFQGVVPAGDGFKLTAAELKELGFSSAKLPPFIRPYIIGRDLVQDFEEKYIIDFFEYSEKEARAAAPALYQRLLDRVYPERKHNKRDSYREKWWIFAEPRPAMRKALADLNRFIVTPYTAKHRPFVFVDGATLPDAMAYAIASDDPFILGVLSSRIHVVWCLSAGGTLEDRPRYNSKATFTPFAFPDCSKDASLVGRVKASAESLDGHRKARQAEHPELTLTEMYNVLERLRSGEPLTAKEKQTHERGLVSVLRQLHDDLDAAVAAAYGWPPDLTDDQILEKLVSLNHQRAEEERGGVVRHLRPDFQNPTGKAAPKPEQLDLPKPKAKPAKAAKPKPAKKLPWPSTLPEQAKALRAVLVAKAAPTTAAELAKSFSRAKVERIEELLETLVSLGQARQTADGKFAAS